ncbi:hypothetical protein FHW83_003361 [Duganella sp. SG902]|uniref:PEP-CTERM sorting domain-containing protein n=1 Tax=Duganella sp. SG902 TaxID=2587016 RepID=UPI00159E22F7|nr:PEP-CTERM sorting domain-containing protein [Duganella sp. SG902]NVM77543.1 hypothetical protein [Duganella sp. SG902]
MKNQKFVGLLATAVFALATSSAATAANYIGISGAHADFYYDADLYGIGTASVVGDSISFALPSFYSATATSKTANDNASETLSDNFNKGLIAVAHTGYQLNASLTTSVTVEFINTGGRSNGMLQESYYVYEGGYYNGHVTRSSRLFIGSSANFYESFTSPGTVIKSSAPDTDFGSGLYSTLIVEDGFYYSAGLLGLGSASTSVTSVSYGFTALTIGTPPITPVPEPETYAMLLAGLGVLAAASRRRKQG